MNLLTKFNLWREKQNLAPRSAFRRVLKKQLLFAWEGKYGVVKKPWFVHYAGAIATGLVVVLTGTTGAYAYTSPQVTDGTLLYPVKRAIEKVEEKTKTTPEAKAAFYLKQIDRREAEKAVLAGQQKRVKRVEVEIEKNEESLSIVEREISTSTSPGIKARVEEQLKKRKERLERRGWVLQKQKQEAVKSGQETGSEDNH